MSRLAELGQRFDPRGAARAEEGPRHPTKAARRQRPGGERRAERTARPPAEEVHGDAGRLGGAFYEMAIRDHVQMDMLTRKAAELQRVDAELLALERMLELQHFRRPASARAVAPPTGTGFASAPSAATGSCRRRWPMKRGAQPFKRAIAAAAGLAGQRFGLLVACSLVATSAIVASAMTNPSGIGPLAALLGQSLASDNTPAKTSAGGSPSPAAGSGRPPPPAGGRQPIRLGRRAAPARRRSPRRPRAARKKRPKKTPTQTPPAPADPRGGTGQAPFRDLAGQPRLRPFLRPGTPQMPYLRDELRPKGELLPSYSLIGQLGGAERDRGDRRPAPEPDHGGKLPGVRLFPGARSKR